MITNIKCLVVCQERGGAQHTKTGVKQLSKFEDYNFGETPKMGDTAWWVVMAARG